MMFLPLRSSALDHPWTLVVLETSKHMLATVAVLRQPAQLYGEQKLPRLRALKAYVVPLVLFSFNESFLYC
jgi:hypothetical protein